MPEMRKCKECGKMFQPKGSERYCSNDHYRPCPICGVDVIVKWFSDPPRKCDNCKRKRMQPAVKPADNSMKMKSLFKIETKNFSMKPSSFNFNPTPKKVEKPEDKKEIEKQQKVEETKDTKDWLKEINLIKQETIDRGMFVERENQSIRIYIGKLIDNGFLPGHRYLVNVMHNGYGYMVTSADDLTTGEIVKVGRVFASQIGYAQNFAKTREIDT